MKIQADTFPNRGGQKLEGFELLEDSETRNIITFLGEIALVHRLGARASIFEMVPATAAVADY